MYFKTYTLWQGGIKKTELRIQQIGESEIQAQFYHPNIPLHDKWTPCDPVLALKCFQLAFLERNKLVRFIDNTISSVVSGAVTVEDVIR